MWPYARLAQCAKHVGGPLGLVVSIAAGGILLGASGTLAIQNMMKKTRKEEFDKGNNESDRIGDSETSETH